MLKQPVVVVLRLRRNKAETAHQRPYSIFWHAGSGKKVITIIAITPHP